MSCQVIFEMKVKHGCFEKLRSFLIEKLPGTRGYPGNICVEVVREQDDPGTILFMEKWASREVFEAYLASRTEEGTLSELADYIEGSVRFRYYDAIGV